MKKLLLILLMTVTYLGSNAQGLWFEQASNFTDVSSGVRNISVVDANVAWMSSYDGSGVGLPRQDYSRTIDGGQTWVSNLVPTTNIWELAHLNAVDANNAWAVFFNTAIAPAGSGQIWHTSDGGANWTQQGTSLFQTAGQSFVNVVHFWDANNGFVEGDPVDGYFEMYTTSDGGATWDSVLVANIPVDSTGTEASIIGHIQVVGDTVWFDTNLGRVFRSVDKGHTWTASSTGITIPAMGAMDICFYNSLGGVARLYDDATTSNIVVETNDGGATWTSMTPTGFFFGGDFKRVPGTVNMMVSTGISGTSGFTGSSYSVDGGHSWLDLETPQGTQQRGALGIADSLTMWCGGFTASPQSGGVFKFVIINPLLCGDPSITAGTSTPNFPNLCGHDTLLVSTTGIVTPVTGDFSGVAVVLTSADISGSHDPVNEPSFLGSTPFRFPAPATFIISFINDGTIVDGVNNAYGVYYFTPVVFGNATGTAPVRLDELTLDTGCTYAGTSLAVNVIDPAVCDNNGISEITANQVSLSTLLRDRNTLDVFVSSNNSGKISIQVIELTGRVVKSVTGKVVKGINLQSINVSDLSQGIYLINAEVNGSRATTRIMKY
jgi:hypothetical protein